MSRVIVTDTTGVGHNYPEATGVNYDAEGYAVIVVNEGDAAKPLAVWAPGQWRCADLVADLVADDGPTDRQEPS